MKLYAGTTEQFVTDASRHRIAEKLRVEFIAQVGHKPGGAEFNAWQNSLTAPVEYVTADRRARLELLRPPPPPDD
jgi:hypothetical protein